VRSGMGRVKRKSPIATVNRPDGRSMRDNASHGKGDEVVSRLSDGQHLLCGYRVQTTGH